MAKSIKTIIFGHRPLGHVDHLSHGIVRGWAWVPAKPNERLGLDIFHDGVFLGQTTTGIFRQDLRAKGFGDGRHGFLFHLPDGKPGNEENLQNIAVVTRGSRRLVLDSAHPSLGSVPRDLGSFFGPYLAELRSRTGSKTKSEAGERTTIDRICAPGPHASAFVSHLAWKYGRQSLLDFDGSALWSWYLGSYATERGPSRAPIAREDICVLMREGNDGRPWASGLLGETSSTSDAQTKYRWAVEESRRLFVEDCLIPPSDVAALREVQGGFREPFPLSTFMRMMRRQNPLLRRASALGVGGRKGIYALVMLLALRSPHYLVYMPSAWLQQMLKDDVGPSIFEKSLAELFGASLSLSAAHYREIVEASGFDIASQSFPGRFYSGHRVIGGPAIVTEPAPVDVQLIGPFRRHMGLGESCRRIAGALRHTGFSLNCVDYNIGNSSEVLQTDSMLGQLQPARLNLLHLNAEEIPEAYAYLSDVFSRSRTVAIPFWELNRLATPHCLGLEAVDEVWVASHFLEEVFAASGRPVRWIGMSSDERPPVARSEGLALRARFGILPETFAFITTSDALSWVQRKNPLGVVAAFQAAFPAREDVALIVKTHNLQGPLSASQRAVWTKIREACDADARIVLVDASFDAAEQRALLAGCDALVSLHRAEGLGLDLIDATRIGLPLVVTGYSGNMDFCSNDTAWLVDYDLVPVDPSEYSFVEPGHLWAEPRLASASLAMRDVYIDKALRRERTARGQAQAELLTSSSALAQRLAAEVKRMLAAN